METGRKNRRKCFFNFFSFSFQGCGFEHISAHSDGKFEYSDDYGGGTGSGFHPPAECAIKSVNRRHSSTSTKHPPKCTTCLRTPIMSLALPVVGLRSDHCSYCSIKYWTGVGLIGVFTIFPLCASLVMVGSFSLQPIAWSYVSIMWYTEENEIVQSTVYRKTERWMSPSKYFSFFSCLSETAKESASASGDQSPMISAKTLWKEDILKQLCYSFIFFCSHFHLCAILDIARNKLIISFKHCLCAWTTCAIKQYNYNILRQNFKREETFYVIFLW